MLLSTIVVILSAQSADIPLVAGVGISGVTQGGRAPAPIDSVQALMVEGKWKEPHAGDKIAGPGGAERTWAAIKANKDGVFEGGPTRGGYINLGYDTNAEKPMLLVAQGDTMVYVNGVPRAGDPYGYGYLKLPFLMKKGHNEFLFSCSRGSLKARLVSPDLLVESVQLDGGDVTVPDIVVGEDRDLWGSVPFVNCSSHRATGARIKVRTEHGDEIGKLDLPEVAPWTSRKVPFRFRPPRQMTAGEYKVSLDIGPDAAGGFGFPRPLPLTLRVRKPTEHYKRTFISKIDGSVQYYAVCPALKPSKDNALIMTVHGASVEGIGQAAAYAPKDWCTIVAPTNRRPYGFDWEDWGRMDAMEVWDIAKKEFPHDPKRVILTGHSMGGHGTWTLGLTYPNEFAAIGPSAGWISFWSYAGGWTPRDPNAVEELLRRSMNSSDTLLMLNNAKMEDVFILHGDKDDNVPVEQARTMKQKLTDIGAKFEYHEEPGAGHWWGNQCVDWPPMFEMFGKARLGIPKMDRVGQSTTGPADFPTFQFTTVNPAVSSTCPGGVVEQQIVPLAPSWITCGLSPAEHPGWFVTTGNIQRLTIPGGRISGYPIQRVCKLDESSREAKPIDLIRRGDTWSVSSGPKQRLEKTPALSGPFKLAFQKRMIFVVGTHGTKEENEWAANKARFDAEQWYYRGNGAVDIVTDNDAGRYRDRNLILYGNADTNSAFRLIGDCPLKLRRGGIEIGGHKVAGNDKAAVFLYPAGSRLIAVVGGTGMEGMRYADRMPYFTSGVAYPDWTILSPEVLTKGSKAVDACGFFGNDWKFDPKNSAFLKE